MSDPVGTQGVPAPPTLDGLALSAAADQTTERWTPLQALTDLAGGGVREAYLAPLPGYPVLTRRLQVSITWSAIRKLAPALDARLAYPGPKGLCLWKHVCLGYRGDGDRAEFFLPLGWSSALPGLVPPQGAAIDRFQPTVQIGFDGDPISVVHQVTAAYDAGEPEAGEAWMEIGAGRWKLSLAPAPGAQVILQVVPVIPVLVSGGAGEARDFRVPNREPRTLLLREVG
jgi:hypothetical protein